MRNLTIIFLFLSFTASASDPIVILAEVKKQSFAGQLNCPEGKICMDVWIRYHLKVKKVLSDTELPKKIKAIRVQHSEYVNLTKEPILFVLNKIEKPNVREYRRADYWIKEMDTPETIYCFDDDLGNYGLNQKILDYSRPNKCLSQKVIDYDEGGIAD